MMNRDLGLVLALVLLGSCATVRDPRCPDGTQPLPDCPPAEAVDDPFINQVYEMRTWRPPGELDIDPVEFGREAEIPIQRAYAKILGPSEEEALYSLAAKFWMVENARHTIDLIYYIYARDLIGYALIGALCDAVKRGVDVRVMVDSTGSLDTSHSHLRALETCADDAGFIRNAGGELTTKKARVQVVVFNALSNLGNVNRRSHDKLLITDAEFGSHALVMAGGRNISLAYYGLKADGTPDDDVYRDSEILLGPAPDDAELTIGQVSGDYYSLVFLFEGNKRIEPIRSVRGLALYGEERARAKQSLEQLKAMPRFNRHFETMEAFLNDDYRETRVLLAHELANLTDSNVVIDALGNERRNPNSIVHLLSVLNQESTTVSRIVSPYIFAARYHDRDGNLVLDDAREVLKWLAENPTSRIEIITNSVITSDNIGAQAIIDMDMAPRLLLSDAMQEQWLAKKGEADPALVDSEAWRAMVNHPQIHIYQTGRLDSAVIGGSREYGKLHAKFLVEDHYGFVGTSNFDYRSRLYNNEMGFFVDGPGLLDDLNDDFERLKALSYRWGSPEWLEMRRRAREVEGMKGWSARNQRTVYKTLRATGLDWYF